MCLKLDSRKATSWGTGSRGLMRGMATLPQGYHELLVVRDKVGRPLGELGVSSPWNVIFFPSVL